MTERFYKAVRPSGTSFHDASFRWVPRDWTPADGPVTVTHPRPNLSGDADGYLSVATVPTDCTGMSWPCRLLAVEPAPRCRVTTPDPERLPSKRAATEWVVVDELPATEALGPQGVHVAALIERARVLTRCAPQALGAATAWDTAWATAWATAGEAAWAADRAAAWYAALGTAWCEARALVVRDLITPEQYDALTLTWRRAVGRIHPDDAEVTS